MEKSTPVRHGKTSPVQEALELGKLLNNLDKILQHSLRSPLPGEIEAAVKLVKSEMRRASA